MRRLYDIVNVFKSLRLVKKDELQVPRVCPIEDYSKVISTNDSIFIHRIYVESGHSIPKIVKQGLLGVFESSTK